MTSIDGNTVCGEAAHGRIGCSIQRKGGAVVNQYGEEAVIGSFLEELMNMFGLEKNDQAQGEENKNG